jgi:hypothetical protein
VIPASHPARFETTVAIFEYFERAGAIPDLRFEPQKNSCLSKSGVHLQRRVATNVLAAEMMVGNLSRLDQGRRRPLPRGMSFEEVYS